MQCSIIDELSLFGAVFASFSFLDWLKTTPTWPNCCACGCLISNNARYGKQVFRNTDDTCNSSYEISNLWKLFQSYELNEVIR